MTDQINKIDNTIILVDFISESFYLSERGIPLVDLAANQSTFAHYVSTMSLLNN